jgi:hypothetical protein
MCHKRPISSQFQYSLLGRGITKSDSNAFVRHLCCRPKAKRTDGIEDKQEEERMKMEESRERSAMSIG